MRSEHNFVFISSFYQRFIRFDGTPATERKKWKPRWRSLKHSSDSRSHSVITCAASFVERIRKAHFYSAQCPINDTRWICIGSAAATEKRKQFHAQIKIINRDSSKQTNHDPNVYSANNTAYAGATCAAKLKCLAYVLYVHRQRVCSLIILKYCPRDEQVPNMSPN